MGNKKSKPDAGPAAPQSAGNSSKNRAPSPSEDDDLVTKRPPAGKNDDDAAPDVKDDNQDKPDESYGFFQSKEKKTFKPAKGPTTKKGAQLHNTIKATMKATLGGGQLESTVNLPPGEDENEWIAVNTVHFYNAANMIYGTCAEFCTEDNCKVMSAGVKYEYLWKDNGKYKKPTRVSAPVYIDNLLNWINEQISNPALFPVDENAKFPRNFKAQVKVLYKRLFRLYAHIYYHHLDDLKGIGANAHLNTCFKHFVFFCLKFDLVDQEEMAPLKKLISKFTNVKS